MSKYSVRFLNQQQFKLWDSFVEQEEGGSVFFKTEWLSNIYLHYNNRISLSILVCINNKNNQLVGGIAFGHQKKLGLNIMIPPVATPYSGVVIASRDTEYLSKKLSQQNEILELLIQELNNNFHHISLVLPPDIKDIRVFTWNKFKAKPLYTYFTKTLSKNEVNNWSPSIRRQIKKSAKQPIKYEKGINNKLISHFYELQELSFKRQKHTFKFSLDSFQCFIKEISKTNKIEIYIAYYEEKAASAQVIVYHQNQAYYWLAGANPKYLNTGINQGLMKEVFDNFGHKNITHFDFIGANTPGIAEYKASYNYTLIPYFHITKNIGFFAKSLFFLKKIMNI
ncbi:MAG: GNAT family N-acetyltransferase [Bacteroidales bacterium]